MSENNLKDIWNLALSQIEEQYKAENKEDEFKLWFNMTYIEDNITTIKVSVPSAFMWQTMMSKGNVNRVKETIKMIIGQDVEIESVVSSVNIFKGDSNPVETNQETPKVTQQINSQPVRQKSSDYEEVKSSSNSSLNSSFTFDNFVTRKNSNNDFAYNISIAVAENPGEKANPLLIYGGVGIGKTHLMQAIGNKIYADSHGLKKIFYTQAENFTTEFINSIRAGTQDKFLKKYRTLDVLLIDDIQFLQGKKSTQEELFYTFEELHKNHKQMIFACDRPLSEIEDMADRLISRLGSGLCLNMTTPDYENRKAIIYKKLDNLNNTLPEDIIDLIAQTVETNVRDLEAALTNILAYKEFGSVNITIDMAKERLAQWATTPTVGNISVPNIQKVIADNYDITVADLKGKNRSKKFSVPRFIAIYIAKEMTEYTYSDLGYEFGGKDHSTIMHAYNEIADKIKTDPSLKQRIKFLMDEVRKCKN